MSSFTRWQWCLQLLEPHLLVATFTDVLDFSETSVEWEARPKETDNHLTWRTVMCGIQPANKNHLTLRVESVLG